MKATNYKTLSGLKRAINAGLVNFNSNSIESYPVVSGNKILDWEPACSDTQMIFDTAKECYIK